MRACWGRITSWRRWAGSARWSWCWLSRNGDHGDDGDGEGNSGSWATALGAGHSCSGETRWHAGGRVVLAARGGDSVGVRHGGVAGWADGSVVGGDHCDSSGAFGMAGRDGAGMAGGDRAVGVLRLAAGDGDIDVAGDSLLWMLSLARVRRMGRRAVVGIGWVHDGAGFGVSRRNSVGAGGVRFRGRLASGGMLGAAGGRCSAGARRMFGAGTGGSGARAGRVGLRAGRAGRMNLLVAISVIETERTSRIHNNIRGTVESALSSAHQVDLHILRIEQALARSKAEAFATCIRSTSDDTPVKVARDGIVQEVVGGSLVVAFDTTVGVGGGGVSRRQ